MRSYAQPQFEHPMVEIEDSEEVRGLSMQRAAQLPLNVALLSLIAFRLHLFFQLYCTPPCLLLLTPPPPLSPFDRLCSHRPVCLPL